MLLGQAGDDVLLGGPSFDALDGGPATTSSSRTELPFGTGAGPGYLACHGLPRPAVAPRRLVPPHRGRHVAHARGGRADLRRRGAALRELRRPHRGAPGPRAPLPPAAGLGAVRAGTAEVGRRPALRPALPRALDGAALAGDRVRAAGAGRARVLPAPEPRQAAVGDVARRGPVRRPLRGAEQDPPRIGGRDLGGRHPHGAVRGVVAVVALVVPAPSSLRRRAAGRGARRAAVDAGRGGARRAVVRAEPAPGGGACGLAGRERLGDDPRRRAPGAAGAVEPRGHRLGSPLHLGPWRPR